MEFGILPSKVFLSKRLNNAFVDKICVVCNLAPEDEEHVLWKCYIAKNVRIWILEWWGIKIKLQVYSSINLWSWLKWFDNHSVKNGWGVTIAAMLWSQ